MCCLPLGPLHAMRETDEETGGRKCRVKGPAGDCRGCSGSTEEGTPLVGGKEGFLEEVM